ncbi:MAG: kinase [Saccharothrix sp.]|nr:kinase [Saccharothrix sp.]
MAVGRAFGTFGELLQGALPDDGPEFLVTFPIDAWSTATLCLCEAHDGLTVSPPHKTKALAVVRRVMAAAGRAVGAHLELRSDLPEGKGMASSSADLVATARAVAAGLGVVQTPAHIEAALRGVEPSDGVMYPEVVAFYHREVRLRQRLGALPPAAVIGHDRGGQVDTIAFNSRPHAFPPEDRVEYARLLARLVDAVRAGDLAEVGRVTTRSAELALRGDRTARLRTLREVCRRVDGLGLVLAHSGTMLGVLLPADEPDLAAKAEVVRAVAGGAVTVHHSLPARGRREPHETRNARPDTHRRTVRGEGAGWFTQSRPEAFGGRGGAS